MSLGFVTTPEPSLYQILGDAHVLGDGERNCAVSLPSKQLSDFMNRAPAQV